jgi:hypothetical protein
MTKLGFTLAGKDHPIVPVMLGDAQLAGRMAEELLKEGIYVIGFSFPVVPKGKARIRRAHHGADRPRGGGLRQGGQGTRRDCVTTTTDID